MSEPVLIAAVPAGAVSLCVTGGPPCGVGSQWGTRALRLGSGATGEEVTVDQRWPVIDGILTLAAPLQHAHAAGEPAPDAWNGVVLGPAEDALMKTLGMSWPEGERQVTEPRNEIPGWEGATGPFPAEYHLPHVYARSVQSGAGNCVCGRHLGSSLHVQAAPGVDIPDRMRS